MGKKRILFIVHRYGLDVNGGAETHCRELAERLLPYYETEVLTSCARAIPWDEYYPPGEEWINGVLVRRFRLEGKSGPGTLERLDMERLSGKEGADEAWIRAAGPYCPELIEYLRIHQGRYRVIFFFTYSHYLTFAGLRLGLKQTVFVPLAHDEPNIYKSLYREVFEGAGAFLFNTVEERKLVCERFGVGSRPHRVTCIGIDMPEERERDLPEKYRGFTDYIIYIGRVAYTKNYAELNKYFIEYKEMHPSGLKLLVLGRIYNRYQLAYHQDIEYVGFVPEEEKYAFLQNARFLVLPSKRESLSFVLLESLALRRPVLVNGYSPVLREQCVRSNGGLFYSGYAEFEAEMDYLLGHEEETRRMGEDGFRFVRENYNWASVLRNIMGLIEEVGA